MVKVNSKEDIEQHLNRGECFMQARCGLCGLEWQPDSYGDSCPLWELETVLLPEDWFLN